jgi:DNA-binding NtrC family response regulator
MRILILDDQEEMIEILSFYLEKHKCSIESCLSGEIAIKLFSKAYQSNNPYSLCFFDLTLDKGIQGAEAAKQIISKYSNARIIVMSGDHNKPEMLDPIRYNFVSSLAKPFNQQSINNLFNSL